MRLGFAEISLFGRRGKTRKPSDQIEATAGEPATADDDDKREKDTAMKDDDTGASTEPKAPKAKDAPESNIDNGTAASAAAQDTAQVVDLDSVRATARAETLAYVNEVQDLCALAGRPELASEFIGKTAKIADVRQSLIAAQASANGSDEISGHVAPEAAGAGAAAVWDRAITKVNQTVDMKR